jgi:hypothetical protein
VAKSIGQTPKQYTYYIPGKTRDLPAKHGPSNYNVLYGVRNKIYNLVGNYIENYNL